MKPDKWTSLTDPEKGKDYLALLSYLPLKKYRSIPDVVKFSSKIDKQLRKTKGLNGFAFHAGILKKQFWTLSVWEDRNSLNDFVSTLPHSEIMVQLAPHMKQTEFKDWKISGADIPPGMG